MGKTTTIGYIVTLDSKPMWEECRKFREAEDALGVLYFGRTATVFPTRRAAERAIQRTKRYAATQGHNWGNQYWICRLVARGVAR